jgi:hypothetical protein
MCELAILGDLRAKPQDLQALVQDCQVAIFGHLRPSCATFAGRDRRIRYNSHFHNAPRIKTD